jgi:replicative DNA helicase
MRVIEDDNVIQYWPKTHPRLMANAKELIQLYTHDFERRGNGVKRHHDSGFDALDKQNGSWLHEGHLIIVAGRPGMGKSIFGQQIAEYLADEYSCIYFSLEMSSHELIERSVCRRSSIPVNILKGYVQPSDLTELQWKQFTRAAGEIAQLNLLIDDSAFSLEQILHKTRATFSELKSKGLPKLGLVVVDYLQLVETSASGHVNRTLAVGEVSRALKRLAKELDVPIIALSQLSRAVESRPDKRPLLSDLRESGNLEQDADLVLMIYRDEVYDDETIEPGIAELFTRKNRHGPNNITVKLPFLGERMSFGKALKTQSTFQSGYSETKRFEPTSDLEDNNDDW